MSKLRSLPRFAAAVVAAAAFAVSAFAQPAAPSGGVLKPAKGQGTLEDSTYYTALKKPLTFEVTGVEKKSLVRLYAGDTIVHEAKASKTTAKITTPKTWAPGEGSYPITASQVVDGVESARTAPFLTLVVDRTPPAPPAAPDLLAESDTGVSNTDNVTGSTTLKFAGTVEPGATAYLAIKGKQQKKFFATSDNAGAYTLEYVKAKAATVSYGVIAVDKALNVSEPGSTLDVTVITKAPKPPSKILIAEADAEPGSKGKATRKLRPTIVGLASPGATVAIQINGANAGEAVASTPSGEWAFTPASDLTYGVATVVARQTDAVGNISKPSSAFAFTVILDNAAPPPGADGAVLVDDFNDGDRGTRWKKLELNDAAIEVNEEDNRLEIPMKRRNGLRAEAGYTADNWALSLEHDFKVQVNWRLNSAGNKTSDIGLAMSLVFDGSSTTGAIFDGVSCYVGGGPDGAIAGVRSVFNGVQAENSATDRTLATGAFFAWYTAADDKLRLSRIGFSDPNPRVIGGVRSASGSTVAAIFLTGWTDGNAPGVDGSQSFFDNLIVNEGTIVTTRLPSEGGTTEPVRADDFDDNVRASFWREHRRNGTWANAVETSRQLEIQLTANPGFFDAVAGYYAHNWSLDLNADFRVRVDWRFPVGVTQGGGVGLTFALSTDGNPENGEVREGLVLFTGADAGGAFSSWSHRKNGQQAASGRVDRIRHNGAHYLRFEAATNRLYYSDKGFYDQAAPFIQGLRTQTRTKAIVILGGYSAGKAPSTLPGTSWFDNFSVDAGALLDSGLPNGLVPAGAAPGQGLAAVEIRSTIAEDLSGDGIVDADDVTLLVLDFGRTGADLRADLNADGRVNAEDLRLLLAAFGRTE